MAKVTLNLTDKQVEEQENLNPKRYSGLKPKYDAWKSDQRPTANLIDLMHWAKESFCDDIGIKPEAAQICIHNKIVMDGSFFQFAEETGVGVECLIQDSLASWKSEEDFEHFMAQGVYKITYKSAKGKKQSFLHCALFHKGNQNEDEVSFFIITDRNQFHEYIDLRNSFDTWLQQRDRNNLEVHVVGGGGYPYTKDLTWDDLFLPDKLKNDIRSSVEGFLASKSIYEKAKIPWKRGMLLYGDPGCGKTSCIKTIMSQYDFKPVTVLSSSQTNDDMISEAFEYAQEQEPGLLYLEDLDTLLSGPVTLSHFLNLMDGVSTKNGIMVVATANDLRQLKEAVLDRPSRFDRKYEFPQPTEDMAKKYIKKWFGEAIKEKDLVKIAEDCTNKKFSYAYLKELYITAAYSALAANREKPNLKDVRAAMEQLLSDKAQVENNFESSNKEEIGLL